MKDLSNNVIGQEICIWTIHRR